MSVVLLLQHPEKAIIVTDTIATDRSIGDRLQPSRFGMKLWTLPHMNMAFSFRGVSVLAHVWHHHLTDVAKCQDIEDVREEADESLRNLVKQAALDHGYAVSGEFVHLGFPHGSDRIVQYTYRSDTDYQCEALEVPESNDDDAANVAFFMAPGPVTFAPTHIPDDVAGFVDLVSRIRDENARELVEDPIAIGGDLFATYVENWKIRTVLWHRFPDYDTTWQTIREGR